MLEDQYSTQQPACHPTLDVGMCYVVPDLRLFLIGFGLNQVTAAAF